MEFSLVIFHWIFNDLSNEITKKLLIPWYHLMKIYHFIHCAIFPNKYVCLFVPTSVYTHACVAKKFYSKVK